MCTCACSCRCVHTCYSNCTHFNLQLTVFLKKKILNSTDLESFSRHLDGRFSELLVQTKGELHRLEKSVDTVYRLLRTQSGNGFHKHVVDQRGCPPANFDEIFDDLNSYRTNSLDYELLETVVRNRCSETLLKRMEQHARDIRELKRRTTISKFITHKRCFMKKRLQHKGHKRLTTKHEINPDVYMLETLDNFQRKVRANSKCYLQWCNMEVGSVLVEWRISEEQEHNLMVFFCGDVGKDLLRQYHILDISIDGLRIDHSVCTCILPS